MPILSGYATECSGSLTAPIYLLSVSQARFDRTCRLRNAVTFNLVRVHSQSLEAGIVRVTVEEVLPEAETSHHCCHRAGAIVSDPLGYIFRVHPSGIRGSTTSKTRASKRHGVAPSSASILKLTVGSPSCVITSRTGYSTPSVNQPSPRLFIGAMSSRLLS